MQENEAAAVAEASAKKKKGPFAVVWSVITWLLVAAVVLLAIALVGVRVLGFTPYAIISPSMTPTYNVGDLVYVKAEDPEKIEVGDVLTFVANEDLVVVTHRVAAVDRENRCFTTKGDANNDVDAKPVLYDNAIGTVRFSLPLLGYVSSYLLGESGRYAAIAIGLTLLLLLILPELFKKPREKKQRQ